jgi:hypothetical protein
MAKIQGVWGKEEGDSGYCQAGRSDPHTLELMGIRGEVLEIGLRDTPEEKREQGRVRS